jgi:MFS family permease
MSSSSSRWGALAVLCAVIFLDALDVSMVGVALPAIQHDLGLTTSSLQWVVSGYVLGYGGLLLLGGRTADLLGRRRVFLAALGVFAVASLLGGVVDDGALLIAARFVKGVAAAFTAPAALSIITTTFPEGPERNRALSIFTACGASGYSLGLVLSGLLTEIGWRWTLLMPVPVAVIALVAALKVLPKVREERAEGGHDLVGAVTITASMLLLVFTVVQAPEAGWASFQTIGSLVGVAALACSSSPSCGRATRWFGWASCAPGTSCGPTWACSSSWARTSPSSSWPCSTSRTCSAGRHWAPPWRSCPPACSSPSPRRRWATSPTGSAPAS